MSIEIPADFYLPTNTTDFAQNIASFFEQPALTIPSIEFCRELCSYPYLDALAVFGMITHKPDSSATKLLIFAGYPTMEKLFSDADNRHFDSCVTKLAMSANEHESSFYIIGSIKKVNTPFDLVSDLTHFSNITRGIANSLAAQKIYFKTALIESYRWYFSSVSESRLN